MRRVWHRFSLTPSRDLSKAGGKGSSKAAAYKAGEPLHFMSDDTHELMAWVNDLLGVWKALTSEQP